MPQPDNKDHAVKDDNNRQTQTTQKLQEEHAAHTQEKQLEKLGQPVKPVTNTTDTEVDATLVEQAQEQVAKEFNVDDLTSEQIAERIEISMHQIEEHPESIATEDTAPKPEESVKK